MPFLHAKAATAFSAS